jgi:hypothetical protein
MATWSDFWAAHDAEQGRRVRGVLGLPYRIAPWLSLRPLTGRDMLELELAGSPFIAGGAAAPEDTALFLWFMRHPREPRTATGWLARRWLDWRKMRFAMRVGRMLAHEVERRITDYISLQMGDPPPARKADEQPGQRRIERCVSVLKLLARLCESDPVGTWRALDLPVSYLWQLHRAQVEIEGGTLINASDRMYLEIMLKGETPNE